MHGRLLGATIALVIVIGGIWITRGMFSTPAIQPTVPIVQPPVVNEMPYKPPVQPVKKQQHPKPKKTAASITLTSPQKTRPVLPVIPHPYVPPPPQEWKGNNDSAITHSGQVVIRNDNQWIRFWAEHRPGEASPDVDFSRSMVVGVFLGQRPADGFAVDITGVRVLADAVVVDYFERAPPPGTFQVAVEVFPYDIKAIPRSELPVKFNKLAAQYKREALPVRSK